MPFEKIRCVLPGVCRLARLTVPVILIAFLLGAVHPAPAQVETVLHRFAKNGTDGVNPYAPLTLAPDGNFYGTTYYGGAYGYGTVFQFTPSGSETIIHSFAGGRADGCKPYFAGVAVDAAGNLYGTTNGCGANGQGTVYKITPSGIERTLHSFGSEDGGAPFAGVVLDEAGNIYGTTNGGGKLHYGAVFKLTPSGAETILHAFEGGLDGAFPWGGLFLGKDNCLYGITFLGGTHSYGNVFKVTLSGTVTELHSFAGGKTDGSYPYAGVVLDDAGNIYGTTHEGGANAYGIVFKLTPSGTETVLHNFPADRMDGYDPYGSGVILDRLGNLYGATSSGGTSGLGTVYEIKPDGTESVLHSFVNDGIIDGSSPVVGVVLLDKMNTLYGTTYLGGTDRAGTFFKIVLQSSSMNGSER